MADATTPVPDDGSSSSNAALQTLTNCVKTIATRDFAYAKCAMSSGLFGIFIPMQEDYENGYKDDEISPELEHLIQFMPDLNSTGTCQLMCLRPMISASMSCCNAVARLHACELSSSGRANEDVVACKSVIDQTFTYQRQCSALSASNAALIAVCAVAVLAISGVALFARITARRRASTQRKHSSRNSSSRNGVSDLDGHAALPTTHSVGDDLEARFAAASPTRWHAFLGAYRQVANLVWKNLLLRRRKPVAFVMEQLLPLLLVGALLILANLDAIFRSSRVDWTTSEAYELPVYSYPERGSGTRIGSTSNYTILCTGLFPIDEVDLGAPNATLRSFYTSGQSVLGLFFLVSYIKFVSSTTTAMVMEKENRMREVMKIMGLSDRSLLCAWCLTSAILSTPLAFAVALVLKFGRVFPSAEVATLAFLFWSLSLAIVSFSYCIAPFFNKSRTAAIVSVLVWLVLFFPFFAVQPKTNATKYWAALCPPTAFALGVDALLRHAQLGMGFAYALASAQSPIDVPTAGEMSWFLVLDSVLLVAIGWYLEQVLPQQYGVRKPFYFLFQRAYWISGSGSTSASRSKAVRTSRVSTPALSSSDGGDLPVESVTTPRDGGAYVQLVDTTDPLAGRRSSSHERLASAVEPVSAVLQTQELKGTCLQLRGLRKVFQLEDGDEHVAVDSLDLTMYCGQITALLGHNGAGKTTTISMLTGLIAPSAGDATLYGRSIQRDFHELRRIIGICPQHDVLFGDLTVDEHLQLFATMKNVAPSELRSAVDTIIDDVGLTETRHVRAKHLSGGQKRKLSVALAFIGDSKLVFLDEPTSGMDPYSRRFTWNVLQKHRADRVIVLTTHFMDEADILGDRIAIVADGKLCCAGSSLFLKTRYGAGYNLTLIKASGDASAAHVGAFLQQFVPDATCLSSFGSELVFQLPTASSPAFPAMLAALDEHLAVLHVLQYGISVTTLEEVFLRIARDREDGAALAARTSQTLSTAAATAGGLATTLSTTPNHRCRNSLTAAGPTDKAALGAASPRGPTFWSQYTALTRKRFQIARRDKKTLANAIGIPLLFLALLAALPTIEVANFIPDYATTLASEAQQLSCPARNVTTSMLVGQNLTNCFSAVGFGYCTLGVVDCDPQVCCNAANYRSPFYPCNTCALDATSSALAAVAAKAPCFNSKCMKRNDAKLQVTMNAFLVATVVMLGFAFIPAAIVAFVVREKAPEQDAKSLQLISGANVSAYWLASWTHDVAVTALSVIAAIVVVPLSARGLHGSHETLAVALLVVLHMLASIPLAYLFSFRFSKHAVAQTSLLVFALSSGGLLSIFSFMCRVIDFRLSSTLMLSALDRNYLRWIFLLFPGYSLNNGIYEIAARKVSRRSLYGSGRTALGTASFFGWFEGLGKAPCRECWDRLSRTCCTRGVFDIDVSGAPIIYAAVEAAVFTALVFYLENRRMVWRKRRDRTGALATPPAENEDDDVAAERRHVELTPPSGDDSVFIRNLHQQYAPPRGKVALKNLSLAIRKGECFGYLGINGAGKSTTMKVLTGTLAPTDGFVMLGPHDLAYDRTRARRLIGYCPQFDALHDLLTVTEQLGLYARLKGVASAHVASVVDEMVERVGLSEYRHKLTRGLSGGNKRKVSTAIALIGSPPVVFLDEPSTGVDPSSRRKMWDVIASVCASKDASVVLTTHSMEECEALCTRVGIMVSGALQCLGSVEHLKQKFGHGFTVEVKLRAPPAAAVASVRAAIERALAESASALAATATRAASVRTSARASRLSQRDATSARITASNIAQLCAALGEEARGERILHGDGNGWVVQHFFETTGSVPLDVLSAWWVSESESEALQAFFAREFAGSTLVEQQGEHFRFQVPKHALRPSAIFALLEDAKTRLHVSEYGVSDTSLEHIFNNMAAQQEEERGVVRGMYQQQQ